MYQGLYRNSAREFLRFSCCFLKIGHFCWPNLPIVKWYFQSQIRQTCTSEQKNLTAMKSWDNIKNWQKTISWLKFQFFHFKNHKKVNGKLSSCKQNKKQGKMAKENFRILEKGKKAESVLRMSFLHIVKATSIQLQFASWTLTQPWYQVKTRLQWRLKRRLKPILYCNNKNPISNKEVIITGFICRSLFILLSETATTRIPFVWNKLSSLFFLVQSHMTIFSNTLILTIISSYKI